ncbi:MAG: peptide chain release factor 1 [Sedimentisphaerales bacterium]|jgi:peptide chain release factor 1|nr:peptide chain release factor 1 [Sedimentisphaerales bacterium]
MDTSAIHAKLDQIEQRFRYLQEQIADPAVAANASRLVELSKEQGKLQPIVTKYQRYKQILGSLDQARQILEDEGSDKELQVLARQEVETLQEQAKASLDDILNSLVMADDDAVGSIIMEIRAGTGGEEAALFARDLYNMYVRYAERRGWKVEQLDFSPTDLGGFREVILSIKGQGVWSDLGFEGGGHRVQRVPVTESQGRIHTSAATVAVLPEPDQLDIHIDPDDVIESVSRAGGPGGQNVNKVSSAIRLEHVPTGITVNMRDERSQHKNREKAWRVLRSRVFEYYASQKRRERDQLRRHMIGSGDRSEKIRTYNFSQNRVTDHRIGLSLYSLDKIMTGELDELVAALKDYERRRRLQQL